MNRRKLPSQVRIKHSLKYTSWNSRVNCQQKSIQKPWSLPCFLILWPSMAFNSCEWIQMWNSSSWWNTISWEFLIRKTILKTIDTLVSRKSATIQSIELRAWNSNVWRMRRREEASCLTAFYSFRLDRLELIIGQAYWQSFRSFIEAYVSARKNNEASVVSFFIDNPSN